MGKTAIVVMGVAGCGKTTTAETMATRLGWPCVDADDFHSDANVAKMRAGTPLTDDDRMPWLRSIRDWISAAALRCGPDLLGLAAELSRRAARGRGAGAFRPSARFA